MVDDGRLLAYNNINKHSRMSDYIKYFLDNYDSVKYTDIMYTFLHSCLEGV